MSFKYTKDPKLYIEEGQEFYKFLDLPWISKSKILSMKFCEFMFYLETIKKLKGRNEDLEIKRIVGTDSHVIFPIFYKVIKDNNFMRLFVDIKIEADEPKNSALFWSFFTILTDIVPDYMRKNTTLRNVLVNFAEWNVLRWIEIHGHFHLSRMNISNRLRILRHYWLPAFSEKFLQDHVRGYYGTLDMAFRNYLSPLDDAGVEKIPYIVVDYKTKEAPKSLKDGRTTIPTPNLMELHMYSWLLANATEVYTKEVVGYCTECMSKIEFDETWKCTKCQHDYGDNPPLEKEKAFRRINIIGEKATYKSSKLCCVYLGSDYPYWALKSPNATTMSNVHRDAEILRKKWEEGGPWEIKPYYKKCAWCNQNPNCSEYQIIRAQENEQM